MDRLDSRVVYANAWMSVREDRVRRADGSTGIYGVVDKTDFALVLPRFDGGFWLVEQFRYPVGRRAWEFPQGSWGPDADPGPERPAGPEQLARAELAEETGLRAAELRHLGHLSQAYGFSSQGFDVYLATGLTRGAHAREPTEQDMICAGFSDDEIALMIRRRQIIDASSLAALTLFWLAHTDGAGGSHARRRP